MRKHVFRKIGDGSSIFFWHDKWWGNSTILEVCTLDVVSNTRYDGSVKLKEMILNGSWIWPKEWSVWNIKKKKIHVPQLNVAIPDCTKWVTNDGNPVMF